MHWANHESYTRLHTHIRCCCTLCYCWHDAIATRAWWVHTYVRMHICFTWVYVSCMRWANHESYAGLHTHKQCCCTLCYCSTMPSLLMHDDTVHTKLLALQTDSFARGTPCTMCTPSTSYNSISLHVRALELVHTGWVLVKGLSSLLSLWSVLVQSAQAEPLLVCMYMYMYSGPF